MGLEIPAGQKTLGDTVLLSQAVTTTSDITITVDGNVDGWVEFRWQGIFTNPGSADAVWDIRPNNANQSTDYYQHYLSVAEGTVSSGTETVSGATFIRGYNGGSYTVEGQARAVIAMKTGCWRHVESEYDYYCSLGKMAFGKKWAVWKESSTNITSIKLVWSTAPSSVRGTLLVRKLKVS